MSLELFYNQQSVNVGPTPCTGAHFTSGNSGVNLVRELFRVTRYDNGFDIPQQDVIQLGQLAAFSREMVNAPTPSWALEFYVTDGVNEQALGFPIDGQTPILSGILNGLTDGKNYFALITQQGVDAMGSTTQQASYTECLGNGYITSLKYTAAVGGFAMATVDIEGSNYALYSGATGIPVPSVSPIDGSQNTTWLASVPEPQVSGDGASMPTVIKYGNLTLDMTQVNPGLGVYWSGVNAAYIQSFDLTIPITRENLLQLGNKFPYARALRPPFNATLSVTAIVNQFQTGSLYNLVNSCSPQAFNAVIHYNACTGSLLTETFRIGINGLYMDGQAYTLSVGQKKMITFRSTIPIGSATSPLNNIYFSGSHSPNSNSQLY